ncbi:hypothetical protein [Exiguobacterium sp. 8H]|uniref:hypothetical protein n=1 Tax=Exiguobacterium sp. 8H TaxID=2653140 RepID=UPI0013584A32|nr:hypothetical protein [Exiguobacterium sp. 8H]
MSEYRLFRLLKEGGDTHSIHFKVDVGQVAPFDFRYRVVADRLECEVAFLGQAIHMPEEFADEKFRQVAETFEQEGVIS